MTTRTAEDLAEEVTALREACRKSTDEVLSLRRRVTDLEEQDERWEIVTVALVEKIKRLEAGLRE